MAELNFYQKLSDIQLRMKAPKSQYNNFGKYSYRNCEDILEAVKPLLNEHQLYINISDSIETIGNRFYVKATVTVSDGVISQTTTNKRYTFDVVANDVEFVERKQSSYTGADDLPPVYQNNPDTGDFVQTPNDEDLPF